MSPAQLATALDRLHLSVSEAARRMRVDRRTLHRWLAGERRIPGLVVSLIESWEREYAIAQALKRKT